MKRRVLFGLAVPLVVMSATSVATATVPPDEAPTDFVRRLAEVEATAHFVALDPAVANVACGPPTVDSAGGQMVCYATNANGAVLTALATINDDGGIDVAATSSGATAPTVAPSTAPSQTLASFQGAGSGIRPVDPITAPTIVRVTHDGAGAFSVQPQQGGVPAGDPLFDVTGAWSGRYLVGLGGTISAFAVTADGNWTIEIQSIDTALPLSLATPVSAGASEVARWADTEAVSVIVDYTGAGPIVVRAISGSGTEVLVDEAGPFAGEVTLPAGPGYITVDAAGPWTVGYIAPATAPTTVATNTATATTIVAATTTAGATTAAVTTTSAP